MDYLDQRVNLGTGYERFLERYSRIREDRSSITGNDYCWFVGLDLQRVREQPVPSDVPVQPVSGKRVGDRGNRFRRASWNGPDRNPS